MRSVSAFQTAQSLVVLTLHTNNHFLQCLDTIDHTTTKSLAGTRTLLLRFPVPALLGQEPASSAFMSVPPSSTDRSLAFAVSFSFSSAPDPSPVFPRCHPRHRQLIQRSEYISVPIQFPKRL
jgi:hypothetical protein